MGHNTAHLVAPVSVLIAFNPADLARYVLSVARILSGDQRLIRRGIIFVFMSNAGALCSMHLTAMLSGEEPYLKFLTPGDMEAFDKLKGAMAAVLFDSAPCYLHNEVVADAFIEGMKIPQGLSSWTVRRACDAYIWFQTRFFWDVPDLFWTNMRDATYPCPEQYIYSTGDRLLDASRLDALIEERKQKGKEVRVLSVVDVDHMLIFKKVPKLYIRTIRELNEWGVNAYRRKVGLSEWMVDDR